MWSYAARIELLLEVTRLSISGYFYGRGGELIIGNNVDIAQEVYIWTEQHDYIALIILIKVVI